MNSTLRDMLQNLLFNSTMMENHQLMNGKLGNIS